MDNYSDVWTTYRLDAAPPKLARAMERDAFLVCLGFGSL